MIPHRHAPRALALAYFLSALCSSLTSIAISVHFAIAGAGPAMVTATLLAGAIAQIVFSPLLAPLFDRYPARRLAALASMADIIVLLALMIWQLPWILILGTFASSTTAGLIIPALFTIAEKLDGKGMAAAFSRMDTARLVGDFSDLTLGGFLIQVTSLRSAFLLEICASLILIVTVLSLTPATPAPPPEAQEGPQEGFLRRAWHAPKLLLRDSQVRSALQSLWGAIVFTSIYNVALVYFAIDVLHVGGLGYAVLTQAFIAGRIIGAKASARLPEGGSRMILPLAGIVMGGAIVLATLSGNLVGAALGFLIAGISNAIQVAALRLLVVRAVPAPVQPKALSAMSAANTSAMLVGYVISAPAVNHLGPAYALILSGTGTMLLSLLLGIAGNSAGRPPNKFPY
ncbi:MFS transporter [Corynebacterium sp. 21KM1197]|uniref:MFS transporter n=1 Tax=Corynebacterium sp. 21KM1197 TaxID=2989734 RepID=UPI0029CA85FA|nr:MFS transporter [Corynebacterium sp. 21KM1197]WPF68322.1 MFS transporter [Corynebacterium sp. 21KM1197]